MREREREREWADSELDIIFLVFCCSSRTCLLTWSVFTASWQVWNFFVELIQNGCHNFRLSLHNPQLSLLLFSILRPLLTAFPFEFFSANHSQWPICCWYISVFNPGVRCYPDLDFGPPLSPSHFLLHYSLSPLSLYIYIYISLLYRTTLGTSPFTLPFSSLL